MAEMRPRSGLARLGACGLVLAAAALIGGALVPGDGGALLRGYGAMLGPAVAWLYAGLALRAVLPHRQQETSRAKVSISAGTDRSASERRRAALAAVSSPAIDAGRCPDTLMPPSV